MVKKFRYNLPFDWNFCYHHAVDDHKNPRHVLSSVGDTWMTDIWECRLFDFILAISEVNICLILHYFFYCGLRWEVMPMLLKFCWKLVWKIIKNI